MINKMSNQIKMNKQEITDSLSRAEMLEIARHKINSHFLTDYKTHEDIMADKQTGCAMIGFMKCWSWLGLDDTIAEKNAPQRMIAYRCTNGQVFEDLKIAEHTQNYLNLKNEANALFEKHKQEITDKFKTSEFTLSSWKCDSKANPVGRCIEDDNDDELSCLYCGAPEERK